MESNREIKKITVGYGHTEPSGTHVVGEKISEEQALKFYAGLPKRRIAEYLLFTAKTAKEVELAYSSSYESTEQLITKYYTSDDLVYMRSLVNEANTDQKDLQALEKWIELSKVKEIDSEELAAR